jgi:hypothetical protein
MTPAPKPGSGEPYVAKVAPAVADHVFRRDRGCVALQLGFVHRCADRRGWEHAWDDRERLTLDHVQEGGGRTGKRASSVPHCLVAICARAGVQGWELSHKDDLRRWIAEHGD